MAIERRATDRGSRRGGVLGTIVPLGILNAPFQWIVSVLSAVLAVAVCITRWDGEPPSVLPLPTLLLWGAMLTIGGAGTAVAMLLERSNRAIAMECATLVLLGTGWLIYSLAYYEADNSAIGPILVGPALFIACLIRILAIYITGRVLRQQRAILAEIKAGAEEANR